MPNLIYFNPSFTIKYHSIPRTTVMTERWLSVKEIAAHLGVSKETIYNWIEEKTIPAHKIGRFWKFKASEVDESFISAGKSISQ